MPHRAQPPRRHRQRTHLFSPARHSTSVDAAPWSTCSTTCGSAPGTSPGATATGRSSRPGWCRQSGNRTGSPPPISAQPSRSTPGASLRSIPKPVAGSNSTSRSLLLSPNSNSGVVVPSSRSSTTVFTIPPTTRSKASSRPAASSHTPPPCNPGNCATSRGADPSAASSHTVVTGRVSVPSSTATGAAPPGSASIRNPGIRTVANGTSGSPAASSTSACRSPSCRHTSTRPSGNASSCARKPSSDGNATGSAGPSAGNRQLSAYHPPSAPAARHAACEPSPAKVKPSRRSARCTVCVLIGGSPFKRTKRTSQGLGERRARGCGGSLPLGAAASGSVSGTQQHGHSDGLRPSAASTRRSPSP
ncbi:hypothetical protein ACFQ2M_12820 [Kitasatospora saccharophila]|uniref:hypothetical protein n=1 Tax=Kitasatospora saccharophila TaxID=407973 RepID=UPI00362B1748